MRTVIASTDRELITASCTQCAYGEQKGGEGSRSSTGALDHALTEGHTVHERIVTERTLRPADG